MRSLSIKWINLHSAVLAEAFSCTVTSNKLSSTAGLPPNVVECVVYVYASLTDVVVVSSVAVFVPSSRMILSVVVAPPELLMVTARPNLLALPPAVA